MGFRYDENRLDRKQVILAYESDIKELERKCDALCNAIDSYKRYSFYNGISAIKHKNKIDELEKRLDIYKLELNALKLELELVLF